MTQDALESEAIPGCIVPAGHGWQASLDEAAETEDHVPAGQAAQ